MSTHPGIRPDSMERIRYSTENSEEPLFSQVELKNLDRMGKFHRSYAG
jgi:hypothetical protein